MSGVVSKVSGRCRKSLGFKNNSFMIESIALETMPSRGVRMHFENPSRNSPVAPSWGVMADNTPWPPCRSTVPRGPPTSNSNRVLEQGLYLNSVGMFSKFQNFKIIRPLSNCMFYKVCPRGEFGSPPQKPTELPGMVPQDATAHAALCLIPV